MIWDQTDISREIGPDSSTRHDRRNTGLDIGAAGSTWTQSSDQALQVIAVVECGFISSLCYSSAKQRGSGTVTKEPLSTSAVSLLTDLLQRIHKSRTLVPQLRHLLLRLTFRLPLLLPTLPPLIDGPPMKMQHTKQRRTQAQQPNRRRIPRIVSGRVKILKQKRRRHTGTIPHRQLHPTRKRPLAISRIIAREPRQRRAHGRIAAHGHKEAAREGDGGGAVGDEQAVAEDGDEGGADSEGAAVLRDVGEAAHGDVGEGAERVCRGLEDLNQYQS
jgi:hypothetical protein